MEKIGEIVVANVKEQIARCEKLLSYRQAILEVLFQFNGLVCSKNKKKMTDLLKVIDPNLNLKIKKSSYQDVILVIYYDFPDEDRNIIHIGIEDNIINFNHLAVTLDCKCTEFKHEIQTKKYVLENFDTITSNLDVSIWMTGMSIHFDLDTTKLRWSKE